MALRFATEPFERLDQAIEKGVWVLFREQATTFGREVQNMFIERGHGNHKHSLMIRIYPRSADTSRAFTIAKTSPAVHDVVLCRQLQLLGSSSSRVSPSVLALSAVPPIL